MTRSLVIVESPAKAKTIAKYLGDDYVVESSIGHIRDLARPSELSKETRERNAYVKSYAVDVSKSFEPLYVVSADRSHIAQLKRELKHSDELLLATDEDREGESIAWHLLEVLKPKVPVKRMVFHEITEKAIKEALGKLRQIDDDLVDAQEARRILDRLYGFAMSDVTRRRARGPSTGRVQSVATRVVVDRERERIAFVRAAYWDLEAELKTKKAEDLSATLVELDGKRVAAGRDFGRNGKLKKSKQGDVVVLDEAGTKRLAEGLKDSAFTVTDVTRKPYTRKPSAPFTTSTLQQEAGRKLRFNTKRTMGAAQSLYQNGYITYMRTDSTSLSATAIEAARKQIRELYDPADLPAKPRSYRNEVKNAQEAHEAIRPAGDEFKTPAQVAREVGPDEAKLYKLIWERTVASQMENMTGERLAVRIEATSKDGEQAAFTVRGNTITFPGFLKAYVEGSDDPEAELENREKHLPALAEGQALDAKGFVPRGHETQPPARYTEASLVKKLEELGVGRPSTYASIIDVIQRRKYVWKKGSALIPSWSAFQVVELLEKHFGYLVDYQFTARMEDDLDEIANGREGRTRYLERFFLGDGEHPGLEKLVQRKLEEIDLDEVKRLERFEIGTAEGKTVVLKVGKYGPYVQFDGQDGATASVPEDLPPDELTLEKALEFLAAPSGDRVLGEDPATGENVLLRAGRYGPYVQLGEAGGDRKEKPKTASLFKSMDPETLTLEDALKLLSLPREVGVAEDGEVVLALNGRYGPYMKKGKENRSLETEGQIFTITLPEALEIFKQPKRGRGRKAAPPLKELGTDPVSEKPIVLKEGRFGPYVTDGETNASLRTGDTVESVTHDRAVELLQLRRERQKNKPKKRRATKKRASKKSTKKKSTKKAAKKATKKKSTKKAAKKRASKKSTKKAAKKATKKSSSGSASP